MFDAGEIAPTENQHTKAAHHSVIPLLVTERGADPQDLLYKIK